MNINLSLLAQAIAFALFIWCTKKWVWPMLLTKIEERQKQIADGLAAGEQGRKSLELSTLQAEEAIKEARSRAADIVSQAERRAVQLVEDAKGAAKDEGAREKAAAKAEIGQELQRARELLREQVAALAVAGAEKILRREVDVRSHAEFLEGIKKQL